MKVVPETVDDTIPGQCCVLLVSVEDPVARVSPREVTITASATGADVLVEHGTIEPGEIAEVAVTIQPAQARIRQLTPSDQEQEGWSCTVTVRARRGAIVREAQIPIVVTSEEVDLLGPLAQEVRDLFIPWLAEHQPELGIDETTAWDGTIVKPHWLVVSHYLFFSSEWEMHVCWHVMIPPYDWARIELRRRFEESLPSLAFEIPSRSAATPEVIEIGPEEYLWR